MKNKCKQVDVSQLLFLYLTQTLITKTQIDKTTTVTLRLSFSPSFQRSFGVADFDLRAQSPFPSLSSLPKRAWGARSPLAGLPCQERCPSGPGAETTVTPLEDPTKHPPFVKYTSLHPSTFHSIIVLLFALFKLQCYDN